MSHPPYPQQTRSDADVQVVAVVLAWIAALVTFFYMLPWAIAATRGKSNHWAVMLLNLLAGWTVIGWFIALIMACTPHQQRLVPAPYAPPQPSAPPAPGWYPAPTGSGQRYWDGTRWTEHLAP